MTWRSGCDQPTGLAGLAAAWALAQQAGSRTWPGEPLFSLALGEVGKALPDAVKGERPAADVLAAAAAAYQRSAAEKGLIRGAA